MALKPLEVIIIADETIRPPGPKLIVCIHPKNGWFYRINTKPWRPAVLITKEPHNTFLDHNSYLECGDPLELDDYIIQEAIDRYGVIGTLHVEVCDGIKKYLAVANTLSKLDKDEICEILNECCGL